MQINTQTEINWQDILLIIFLVLQIVFSCSVFLTRNIILTGIIIFIDTVIVCSIVTYVFLHFYQKNILREKANLTKLYDSRFEHQEQLIKNYKDQYLIETRIRETRIRTTQPPYQSPQPEVKFSQKDQDANL